MIDIEKLKAAALAATPGPWAKGRTTHHTISKHPDFNGYEIAEFHHAHDAELLDFANPSAILELIERLEKAEKDAADYKAQLSDSQAREANSIESISDIRFDLIRMRCPEFFDGVSDGYAKKFDDHIKSIIKNINEALK